MIRDESGADSLPVAIAGAVLLAAIVVGLAAWGMKDAAPATATAWVDGQVSHVANDCRFLLSLAPGDLGDPGSPAGACRRADLDLPAGTEYVSFGRDPGSGRDNEGTIYYKVHGTKKAIVVDTGAAFRAVDEGWAGEFPPGEHMLLRAGRHLIRIEYAKDAMGQRYLLLSHANAA